MVIGEADGLGKYDRPGALHEEKLRQEALEQLGLRVVRWTHEEMWLRPAVVLERIRRALDARAGLGARPETSQSTWLMGD
jgi:very-short-patch-repair endonuclease